MTHQTPKPSIIEQNKEANPVDNVKELAENDIQLIQITDDRNTHYRTAEILNIDHKENTYEIRYQHRYETIKQTVSADAFIPLRNIVANPITETTFDNLETGNEVRVFLPDYHTQAVCVIEDIHTDTKEIHVKGEVHAQTINRTVPKELVYEN